MQEAPERKWPRQLLKELSPNSTVSACIKAYLVNKFEFHNKYSESYRDTTKSTLKRFVEKYGYREIQSIGTEDCERWVFEAKAVGTKRKRRNVLSAFFRWLWQKEIVEKSPIERVSTVKSSAEDRKILMLSNEQVEKTLNYVLDYDKSLMSYIWLRLGLGLRHPEVFGCNIRDLDLVIDGSVTKTSNRRVIPIPDWLLPAPASLRVEAKSLDDRVRTLKNHVGGEWPVNAFRHTAISHWVNCKDSLDAVAKYMGNSPDVIKQHYNAQATRRETEVFRELWRQALN